MNAKEMAAVLDGLSYKEMVPPDVVEEAKENGLVIVYGSESDTMEFHGAVVDTFPCYVGCVVYLDREGVLKNKCANESCPYYAEKTKYAVMWVKCSWGERADYTRTYTTNVPYESFDVLQDGEKYCRGIVFDLPIT